MRESITYSLLGQNINSNQYYRDVKILADETLVYGEKKYKQLIDDFRICIRANNFEALRSREEYILEALIIGVLWNVYSSNAKLLTKINEKILVKLVNLRKNGGKIKTYADFIRGFFSTIFLTRKSKDEIDISFLSFKKLEAWLLASGEFNEEVKRFSNWERYLKILPEEKLTDTLKGLIEYGVWFENKSEHIVGKYTLNVKPFLEKQKITHGFKEDIIFTGRQRIEYHLNMVGAEILNKAFRGDFLKTRNKKLLIPICMRYNGGNECKAKAEKDGYVCGHCTKECRINKLSEMGNELGFQVLIIPHGSSAFADKNVKYGEIGIVGVACLLNLLSGGFAARQLNLVPQCVILDYCGCKKHWHQQGIVTDINMNELKNVMNKGIERKC
jgi:hypothetical protein